MNEKSHSHVSINNYKRTEMVFFDALLLPTQLHHKKGEHGVHYNIVDVYTLHTRMYGIRIFFSNDDQRNLVHSSHISTFMQRTTTTNEWSFVRSVGMWVFQLVAHSNYLLLYAPLAGFLLYSLFVSMNKTVYCFQIIIVVWCCCYRWCIFVFIWNWYILCKCVGWTNSLHMHFRLLVCYGWIWTIPNKSKQKYIHKSRRIKMWNVDGKFITKCHIGWQN